MRQGRVLHLLQPYSTLHNRYQSRVHHLRVLCIMVCILFKAARYILCKSSYYLSVFGYVWRRQDTYELGRVVGGGSEGRGLCLYQHIHIVTWNNAFYLVEKPSIRYCFVFIEIHIHLTLLHECYMFTITRVVLITN